MSEKTMNDGESCKTSVGETENQKLLRENADLCKQNDALRAEIAAQKKGIGALRNHLDRCRLQEQQALSLCRELELSKSARVLHLLKRIEKQFVRGNVSDKTAFCQWLKRSFQRKNLPDPNYNPFLDLSQKMAAIFSDCQTDDLPLVSEFPEHYNKYDVLFFSVIDYDFRYQRPQQIADYYARNGHRVFFFNVNFVNGGKPVVVRKKENLFQVTLGLTGGGAIYQDATEDRAQEMCAALDGLLCQYGIADCVAIAEYPNWNPALAHLKTKYGAVTVLDYLDDYCGFEHTATEALVANTERILAETDKVIASSSYLQKKALERQHNVALVRNGTDFEHFHSAFGVVKSAGERKQIGYYGALSHWFDYRKIEVLAKAFPEVDVVLIGEVLADVGKLKKLPNVKFLGEKKYTDLPGYLKSMDVCLIPFDTSTSLIQATNPVKFYEYLSAGKKVVATEIPELEEFRDRYVYLTNNDQQFVEYVRLCLEGRDTLASSEECCEFARANDWNVRMAKFSEEAVNAFPMFSIVVLSYNQLDYLKLCLHSILKWTAYPNYELIVSDNASDPEVREYLRTLAEKNPRVRLVLNEQNLGFAAGNNQGLAQAKGDYLVLLNNDTIISRGWLSRFAAHFHSQPDIGAIGPVTNSIGDTSMVAARYESIADFSRFAWGRSCKFAGEQKKVDNLAMFCFAVPRKVYQEVGPISEDYGMGMFEDDDYCMALKRRGEQLICAEDVFVHHFLSASFSRMKEEKRQALMARNQAIFERKWGCRWLPHQYRNGVFYNTNKMTEDAYPALKEEGIQL